MNKRPTKGEYFFKLAKDVALRSTCTRRKFGAILIKGDAIISSGYNGSVRGAINCGEEVKCLKDKHKEETSISYNHCPAVHAETNVLLNVIREGIFCPKDSTMYLAEVTGNYGGIGTDRPCSYCRRLMIQVGIKDIWYIKHMAGNVFKVMHEYVKNWVKLENEWIEKENE